MTTTAQSPLRDQAVVVTPTRRLTFWLVGMGLVLLAAIAGSLAIGARDIPLDTVWDALFHYQAGNAEHALVRSGRVTRTFIGVVAGGALALAGSLAQSVTRNPLADPGLLGINAGAALAVVLGLTVFSVNTFTGQLWLAFAGAALAAVVVLIVGGRSVSSPLRLALAGAAITAALSSITSGLLLLNPFALGEFRFWLAGSLVGRSGAPVLPVLAIAAVALILAVASVRSLSALALGDDAAASLGVRPWRTRAIVMTAVALLAGLATALAGPIIFIGLAVPHLVRAVTGPRLGWLLGASVPAGAAVVLICDIAGRVIASPSEIAVGVTTALIGGAVLALMAPRLKVAGL